MTIPKMIAYACSCVVLSLAMVAKAGGDEFLDKGIEAFEAGRYSEAIQLFTETIDSTVSSDEDKADALGNRGSCSLALGEPIVAIDDFSKAIELMPDESVFYMSRALARGNTQLVELALLDYEKALAIDPDFAPTYYNRGRLHAANDNTSKAFADMTRALELDPGFTVAAMQLADWYSMIGELESAITVATEGLRINEQPVLLNTRALLFSDAGRPELAFSDLTRAIELKPGFDLAIANRAQVLNDLGRFPEAVDDIERALELNPGQYDFLVVRSAAFIGLERLDEALEDLDTVIEAVGRGDSVVLMNRGIVKMMTGEPEEAIEDFGFALAASNPPHRVLFYRGAASLGIGAIEASESDLRRYLEGAPDHAYGAMMYFLAARGDNESSSVLRAHLAKTDNPWIEALLRALLAEIHEDKLLEAAKDPDPQVALERRCEGHFYAGQRRLLLGDNEGARRHFLAAKETGLIRFIEYQIAVAALDTLSSATASEPEPRLGQYGSLF